MGSWLIGCDGGAAAREVMDVWLGREGEKRKGRKEKKEKRGKMGAGNWCRGVGDDVKHGLEEGGGLGRFGVWV